MLGYATVGVNVRGTGCSGGAFDAFEQLQALDGYDVVETVAAQPWVEFGKVGMVGISYPGIMQLYTAGTQPPHLAAISPLSVIDDIYRATLYPGGILNTGFASTWAAERQADAEPGGQPWAAKLIDGGDETCAANQALRGQNHELADDIEANEFYTPGKRADAITPYQFVDRIDVPVFLAGAWQDEQTGGHFPDMLNRFTSAPIVRFTMTNGTHSDSLGPALITRLGEFLDLYVAQRTPEVPDGVRSLAPVLYASLMGVGGVELPPDRFRGMSYEEAKQAFEQEPAVRILFENGGGEQAGAPLPVFEASFAEWPPPETEATTWYFGPDGTLTDSEPAEKDGADSYEPDPSSRPETSLPGESVEAAWVAQPPYTWEPLPDGTAVSYLSEPLAADTAMVGTGSVDLWVQSTAKDADLQATITEVRPDGKEVYVQNGLLRASHRAIDREGSTELLPRHTHTKADAEATAGRQVLAGPGGDVPVRARLPRGLPAAHHGRGAGRRPAALAVRHARHRRGHEHDRPFGGTPVARRAPRRHRRRGAAGCTRVRSAARPALPGLRCAGWGLSAGSDQEQRRAHVSSNGDSTGCGSRSRSVRRTGTCHASSSCSRPTSSRCTGTWSTTPGT